MHKICLLLMASLVLASCLSDSEMESQISDASKGKLAYQEILQERQEEGAQSGDFGDGISYPYRKVSIKIDPLPEGQKSLRLSSVGKFGDSVEEAPNTDFLDSYLGQYGDEDYVKIVLKGKEVNADFKAFKKSNEKDYAVLASNISNSFFLEQSAILSKLPPLNARNVSSNWIDNQINLEVKKKHIKTIKGWSEVKAIYEDSSNGKPNLAYGGEEIRNGMLLDSFIFNPSFHYDGIGGRADGGELRIGVFEYGYATEFSTNHYGWIDYPGGPSRVKKVLECASGTCVNAPPSYNTGGHGTIVASLALGSIEQAQDPNYTSTLDRTRRSGLVKEGELYYYHLLRMD